MSSRMDNVWSKLDRKSTAIAEFTLRQYRTKISTWVVLIASTFSSVFDALILCRSHDWRNRAI